MKSRGLYQISIKERRVRAEKEECCKTADFIFVTGTHEFSNK